MDGLEQEQDLRVELGQLKEQMAKMLEMLDAMLRKKSVSQNPSASHEEHPAMSFLPPGFTQVPLQIQGFNQQGIMVPFTVYPNHHIHSSVANLHKSPAMNNPLCRLPRGYVSPITTDPQDSNPNPHNIIQTQNPHTNVVEASQAQHTSSIIPTHVIPSQTTNPTESRSPIVKSSSNPTTSPHTFHFDTSETQAAQNLNFAHMPHFFSQKAYSEIPFNNSGANSQSKERLELLESRLRAIEGANSYGLRDASELCLVPNVVIPPKFKVPDFDKYRGTTCPKNHLTMYVRKMASHTHDDQLLIHFFQDSLTGAASSWYVHLERACIRSFKDLADAFLRQYKYNIDMAPNRMQLQNMSKEDTETFKEYAQRWSEVAAQVIPPLAEKEVVTMFIDTLQSPFYDMMIGSVSSNFSDMVIIGERIDSGMRSGKIGDEDPTEGVHNPQEQSGNHQEIDDFPDL